MNVDFDALETYLLRVPSVKAPIEKGANDSGHWWCRFALNINHALAWNVVQELAHVLNYISIDERLPGVFKPVSPPPYVNGGPREFLSWVIESTDSEFTPALCAEWLEARLPRPVEDLSSWLVEGRS